MKLIFNGTTYTTPAGMMHHTLREAYDVDKTVDTMVASLLNTLYEDQGRTQATADDVAYLVIEQHEVGTLVGCKDSEFRASELYQPMPVYRNLRVYFPGEEPIFPPPVFVKEGGWSKPHPALLLFMNLILNMLLAVLIVSCARVALYYFGWTTVKYDEDWMLLFWVDVLIGLTLATGSFLIKGEQLLFDLVIFWEKPEP